MEQKHNSLKINEKSEKSELPFQSQTGLEQETVEKSTRN